MSNRRTRPPFNHRVSLAIMGITSGGWHVRSLALLVVPLTFVGCVSSPHRVSSVPASAWRAAADSPRTLEPTTPHVHRDPVRQAPSASALSKEQVLTLANAKDPHEAIDVIGRPAEW